MRGGPRCYAAPIRLVATLDFVLARAAREGFPHCSDWHIKCFVTNGRSWPGRRVGGQFRVAHLFDRSTERLNDEIQARVYMARRLYAGAEPARQNADQGICLVPD